MTQKDWDFAFGGLGDPLADIEDWMIPPFPQWVLDKERKEYACRTRQTSLTTHK